MAKRVVQTDKGISLFIHLSLLNLIYSHINLWKSTIKPGTYLCICVCVYSMHFFF